MLRMIRLAVPGLWCKRTAITYLLLPLSWFYCAVVRARRACYRWGLCRIIRFTRPVVVVGGITVGGSGKTPVVMHVARLLLERGLKPGVVSRGYGARAGSGPLRVDGMTPVSECGDEPALLARGLNVPVVVDIDRPRGVNELISRLHCDVVVSDDGLQHYRMDRRVEIAVVGAGGGFGNGWCLPAGPLREPRRRLDEVDLVVCNGTPVLSGACAMRYRIDEFRSLNGSGSRTAADFGGGRVHAVAGTGRPERFFEALRELGLSVEPHPFPDHHPYRFQDFAAMRDAPIVMTGKDAVKCEGMPLDDAWYTVISTNLDEGFDHKLIELLGL